MRKGFTILEIIIVIGIFSIVSVISIDAYLNGFRNEQQTNIQNKVVQDAKYVLSQIAKDISESKIDFEEYYSQCVIQGACPNKEPLPEAQLENIYYGINHGYYAWQFYDGGFVDSTESLKDGFGTTCKNIAGEVYRFPADECDSGSLSDSEDSNTGVNPSVISLEDSAISAVKDSASAFHSTQKIKGVTTQADGIKLADSKNTVSENMLFNELYLYNQTENIKSIYGLKKIDANNSTVAKMQLTNSEAKSADFAYPLQVFTCANDYICDSTTSILGLVDNLAIDGIPLSTPKRADLYNYTESNLFTDFVPIAPLSVNIKTLKFLISSKEDPDLAYRETGIQHPMVTIFLELEPSSKYKLPFFSNNFSLSLQTTVATSF
jgi:prepilin-type N-terminal cleavage/methylation domain-containing protein